MGTGNFGCFQNCFGTGLWVIKSNIFRHSSFKQQRILRNDSNLTPQTRQVDLGDVVIIDENTTLLRFIKTGQQLHQGAFTTAALTDNTNKTAGIN